MHQYHINDKGEVGRCEALVKCPFGDFDSHHYSSEEEAWAAYEAAMRGEVFKKDEFVSRKKKPNPYRDDLVKEISKLDAKGELPRVPQDVGQGFFIRGELLDSMWMAPAHGLELVETSTNEKEQTKTFVARPHGLALPNQRPFRVTFKTDENGKVLPGQEAWIDQPSYEEQAVRAAQVRERSLAISHRIVHDEIKRSFKRFFQEEPKEVTTKAGHTVPLEWSTSGEYVRVARLYSSMLEDAEKAGVSNPHTFAMSRLVKTLDPENLSERVFFHYLPQHTVMPGWRESGKTYALQTFRRVMEMREDRVGLDEVEKAIIRSVFPEGKRPYLDYTFSDTGIKPVA